MYQGQVVHGITGRPIPRAVVIHSFPGKTRDASGLEPGQWRTIEALGPDLDPNDPALAPLMDRLDRPPRGARECTLTDENGWYRLTLTPGPQGPPDALLVQAQGFLGVLQQLSTSGLARGYREYLTPDENGSVTLQPLKLFPAGTLVIHPVVSDLGLDTRRARIRFHWTVSEDNRPSWLADLWALPKDNNWASTFRKYELTANLSQTLYVPAGLDLKLTMYQVFGNPPPPTSLGTVRLEQGEVVTLGRVEFNKGVEISVIVVDQADQPVESIRVFGFDESGTNRYQQQRTDDQGRVRMKVHAHSAGRLCAVYVDRQTRETFEECVPFEVGGDEDAGTEFTLQLSNEMLDLLRAERR